MTVQPDPSLVIPAPPVDGEAGSTEPQTGKAKSESSGPCESSAASGSSGESDISESESASEIDTESAATMAGQPAPVFHTRFTRFDAGNPRDEAALLDLLRPSDGSITLYCPEDKQRFRDAKPAASIEAANAANSEPNKAADSRWCRDGAGLGLFAVWTWFVFAVPASVGESNLVYCQHDGSCKQPQKPGSKGASEDTFCGDRDVRFVVCEASCQLG